MTDDSIVHDLDEDTAEAFGKALAILPDSMKLPDLCLFFDGCMNAFDLEPEAKINVLMNIMANIQGVRIAGHEVDTSDATFH